MADKKGKKSSDNESYFAAVLGVIIIAFVGFIMVISGIQRLVPSKKYVSSIVKYANNGIENLNNLKYPLITGSLRQVRDNLVKVDNEMRKIAEFESEYQKRHKGQGFNTFKLLFSGKDNIYKNNLKKFFSLYFDFIKYRADVFFYYLMSLIIEIEYITIFFVIAVLLIPLIYYGYRRYMKKNIEDGRIYRLSLLMFLSAVADDELNLIKKHSYAGKYLIDIDVLRSYVKNALLGRFDSETKNMVSKRVMRNYKTNPNFWQYFYAIGSIVVFMKNALVSKEGKLKPDNVGYPASLTGHHNPDVKYGLLVHSFAVAYYAVYTAHIDGVEDMLELLKIFYAGFVHDTGKIRLYKKVVGGIDIVDAPDAVDGIKHIQEAKKKAKKNKERWVSFLTNSADQETQKKIFLSKTVKIFDDEKKYKEKHVKPADHACVDAELRYTALEKKERDAFLKKAVTEFFQEREENRQFNSFNSDMVGIVFTANGQERLFLLATFATRLRRFIEDRYGEKIRDLKLRLPLGAMAVGIDKGEKIRPFSYTVSHFLYENGFVNVLRNPKADIVGLYNAVIKRPSGQVVEYNACWLVNDFDVFCKTFKLTPDIRENDIEVVEILQRIKDKVNDIELKEAEKKFDEETKENKTATKEKKDDIGAKDGDEYAKEQKKDSDKDIQKDDNGLGMTTAPTGTVLNNNGAFVGMAETINADGINIKELENDEERDDGEKVNLEDITLAFKQDGVSFEKNEYRIKKYLSDDIYRKLREDTYKKYNGRCALCGREIEDKKKMRILEKYKPSIKIVKNGDKIEKKKKLVLTGVELLCDFCYIIKTADVPKMKNDEKYKQIIFEKIKRLTTESNENEIMEHLRNCDKRRQETQKEYDTISLSWLVESGYINKNKK